jgi:hypothetical protein
MPAYQGAQPQKFLAEIAGQEQPAAARVAFKHTCTHMEREMPFKLIMAAAFATALSGTAHAQQPTTTLDVTARSSVLTAIPSNATTVTNYYKQNVYDPSDSKIGEIVDVLVGNGMDSKDVAIPFSAVRATNKNGSWHLTMNVTKDALKAAPGYKYDKARANWVPA